MHTNSRHLPFVRHRAIFFHVHAGQVAGEHGGRAQVRLAVGKHREFNREAASLDHAAFYVFGNSAEVGVARGQF